jgi:hypothetical protein
LRFRFEGIGRHQVTRRPDWWFVSLTLPYWARERPYAWRVETICKAWTKLHERINRHTGRRVAYLVVLEPHEKDGTPHLHALLDAEIGKEWLRKKWVACGGGYMVSVFRAKDPGFRIHYVSKHLERWSFQPVPRGFRRYRYGGGLDMKGVRPRLRRRPGDLLGLHSAKSPPMR